MPVSITATILVAILAIPATRAEGDDPGIALQLARRLTPPSPAVEPNETERALLRVEWRTRQSKVDEATAIDSMQRRLDDLGRSLSKLRAQLVAMPATPNAAPVPSASPAAMPEPAIGSPAPPATDDPWGLPGLSLAGVLAVLTAGALLFWKFRRRRAPAAFIEDTTFEPLIAAPRSVIPTIAPSTTIRDDAEDLGGTLPGGAEYTPLEVLRNDEIPLELADILISMGLIDGATETLEQHIREYPRQALVHWLKLLEIYRKTSRQADFEKAAAELNQQFNVATIDWDRREFAPAPSIENYPHIRNRLQYLWRRRGCVDYLTQLLDDNRAGTRTGFPQPVIEEILLLLAMSRR